MNAYNPDHVPNTPWLTAMKSNPDFTLFTNAYSCVWYTVPVLEHALTESNFYNDKPFNESISIIDMAKKAGDALRQINDATMIALNNVSDVAAATSEQSQASGSVARNVEQISSMLEESAQSVHAANENVLILEQLADDLRQSVARFRV